MAQILLVDDSPAVLKILSDVLTAAGHAVATSTSGEDALARLVSEKYDIIVLDITMPSMDGYAVMERLSADAPPVVLITGGLVDEGKFTKRTPARFWQKSYPPSQLSAIIGEVLGQSNTP